jgi:UDP:flavonoid glycosyltransferase YjiC (YdhE family)
MRILLAPHGTRGDVQPMLALAAALASRGHQVSFVAPSNNVDWIESFGYECRADLIDVERAIHRDHVRLQSLRWQLHYLTDVLIPAQFQSVAEAARAVNPSLIVGAGAQMAATSVAEWRGVPGASVVFAPCAVPSRSAPPPIVHRQTLPRWANWWLWRLGAPLGDLLLRPSMNAGRKRLGLRPHPKPTLLPGGDLMIVASDRELGPFPADAPPRVAGTDAWTLDDARGLDPRLEAFLRVGPPPVYLGLGSMVAKPGFALASRAIAAARAVGCRLVIVGGWARIDRSVEPSETVLAIEEAPHQALFARVAGAIHHGGAGTTAAVARAGVPQLVVPHILDQYYWAHRVVTLGLGPAPLPIERVTSGRLIPRLRSLVESSTFRENARALGARVAARSGISDAANLLEGLAAAVKS